ncbi:MAG: hypothetical protein K8E66_07760, partial [Phycisphaerales bacterium]|nr:hypothetical protein [Phycisphaerales bacterium]
RDFVERIKSWTDDRFNARHALEGRIGEVFPTLSQLTNFILLGHSMMHLGQMSTWRRAIGLGSAT